MTSIITTIAIAAIFRLRENKSELRAHIKDLGYSLNSTSYYAFHAIRTSRFFGAHIIILGLHTKKLYFPDLLTIRYNLSSCGFGSCLFFGKPGNLLLIKQCSIIILNNAIYTLRLYENKMSTSSITSCTFSSTSTSGSTTLNNSSIILSNDARNNIPYDETRYKNILQTLQDIRWPSSKNVSSWHENIFGNLLNFLWPFGNSSNSTSVNCFPNKIISLITEYDTPKPLFIYEHSSEKFVVFDVEGNLVIQKHDHNNLISTSITIEKLILKANKGYGKVGISIKDVLSHKNFNQLQFIQYVLAPNKLGKCRLFGISNAAALDILDFLKAESKTKDFDLLKIVDPLSKRNYFIQAAFWCNKELLDTLIERFPQTFLLIGEEVMEEFAKRIKNGPIYYCRGDDLFPSKLAEKYQKAGGKLDIFHTLLIKVCAKYFPDEVFKKEFSSLSKDQQRILYDVAFACDNPFIHEQSESPVKANQYSINLMWINKNKIAREQEFFLGDNKKDFYEKFIRPVSKWAKANVGSTINIWFDGEMANKEAIERSIAALQNAFNGTSHGKIIFRDVRSIETVRANPQVFSEKMPVYFRADLLRAIAGDHILRNKETKFFVYSDFDVEPLSGQEIFDKRTVNFLNNYGFVMTRGGHLGFENNFQILNGDHLQFMKSHRKVIIDLSIDMAIENPKQIHEQQIYDTYLPMFTHFLDADGRYGRLNIPSKIFEMGLLTKNDIQDPKLFRLDNFHRIRLLSCGAHEIPIGHGLHALKYYNIFPSKSVPVPPSHFGI